jgi:hypothetical protein
LRFSDWSSSGQFAKLKPKDWIVLNAANSHVARCVIAVAKSRDLNIVELTLPFAAAYKPSQIKEALERSERGGRILLDFN